MDNVPPPMPSNPPGYPSQGYTQPGYPPQGRNWFQRNWLWFIPTGCVTILVVLALFVGGIVMVAMSAMKSSDAYRTAVQRAKADPRVAAALGSPLTEGLFVTGNTNLNNDTGNASLSVPLEGPKGKGTLSLVAAKLDGVWTYSRLRVSVNGSGEVIDLLDPAAPVP